MSLCVRTHMLRLRRVSGEVTDREPGDATVNTKPNKRTFNDVIFTFPGKETILTCNRFLQLAQPPSEQSL